MNAPHYWRTNKEWARWINLRGTVIASTIIAVAPAGLESLLPYSLVLVEFENGERREFLGAGHESFSAGQTVRCVLRRLPPSSDADVIPYGIKVTVH